MQLLHGRCGDKMMLLMRPSHKGSTCVFNARRVFRQKRGNGPIRNIEDFCCKPFRKRLFSRWRHSIAKMFYRMRALPRSLRLLSNQWTDGVSIISSLPALALRHLPEGANLGFPWEERCVMKLVSTPTVDHQYQVRRAAGLPA